MMDSRHPVRFWLAAITTLLALTLRAADASADLRSIFQPLATEAAALSPDGHRVAFALRENDGVSVYIVECDSGAKVRVRIAEDSQNPRAPEKTLARVRFLHWAGPDDLLIQQRDYPTNAFFTVRADGVGLRRLIDENDAEWRRIGLRSFAPVSVGAISPQPAQPGFADLEIRGIPRPGSGQYYSGLYRFDLRTTRWKLIEGDEFPGRFLYDGLGQIRGRHTDRADPPVYCYRTPPSLLLRPLATVVPPAQRAGFELTPENYFEPRSITVGFGAEPHVLYYASSVGRDTAAFYALDLRTGQALPEKIEDELFDVINPRTYAEDILVRDPHRAVLAGVRYTRLKKTTRWFDPELATLQDRLEERWPAHSVEILGWDRDRTRCLGLRYSRSDPGEYFLCSLSGDRVTTVAPRAPALPARFGGLETRPWIIERPGALPLTGYLTLPAKRDAGRLPVVVYFPLTLWERPLAVFKPEVCALAQMGVAVLEVNHRGLPGRGLEHWQAGRGRAGDVAAEDVALALDDHIRRGVIDARRVGVFGWQFGGHLALRVLQLRPERFACGVIAEAPSDLDAWLNQVEPRFVDAEYRFRRATERWFFGASKAQLDAQSPLYHRRPIGRPLLLLADSLTQTITPRRFEAMQKKLLDDREKVTISRAGELLNPSGFTGNALAYAEMQAFFAQHLGSSKP